MSHTAVLIPKLTIGVDLGDRTSRVCGIDEGGRRVIRDTIATTPHAFRQYFTRPSCRVVVEAGTQSPWASRVLRELGHEIVVTNPSETYGRRRRKRRNDDLDAEFLARQGRADPTLLHPIHHRSAEAQRDLEVLRARDQLVGSRTALVNHVRGAVKSYGGRLARCSAAAFAKRAHTEVPRDLAPALQPVVSVVEQLNGQIRAYDRVIEQLIDTRYPAARRLQQITGVGPITSLAFVLVVDDPKRFKHSRSVGAYVGLCTRLDESGELEPQLRITKAGDALLRKLLVGSAQYILGPFGPECDLRRFGHAIASRGGKNARKRAAVAVARKLAVMMHRLWVSNRTYDPDRLQKRTRR